MVGGLVDRYVKDVVLRRDLKDGWAISGPQMRGGTSRKAWLSGNVPVQRLVLIGTSWNKSWTATYRGPNEFGLDVYFRLGRGKNAQMWDDEMEIDRIHGKWLVNGLYTQAVLRLDHSHHGSCPTSNCQVTGLNDFKGASGPGSAVGPAPLASSWLGYVIGGIAGIPLTILVVYLLYARSRSRRAWADYVNTKRA